MNSCGSTVRANVWESSVNQVTIEELHYRRMTNGSRRIGTTSLEGMSG